MNVQAYAALKFSYETTLKRDWEGFRIPKGKTGTRLPVVLSQQEVEALLGTIKNLKHQAILMTIDREVKGISRLQKIAHESLLAGVRGLQL